MTEYGPSGPEQKEEVDWKKVAFDAYKAYSLIKNGKRYVEKNKNRIHQNWRDTVEEIKEDPLSWKESVVGFVAETHSGFIDDQIERLERRRARHDHIRSSVEGIPGRKTEWSEASSRTDESRESKTSHRRSSKGSNRNSKACWCRNREFSR